VKGATLRNNSRQSADGFGDGGGVGPYNNLREIFSLSLLSWKAAEQEDEEEKQTKERKVIAYKKPGN